MQVNRYIGGIGQSLPVPGGGMSERYEELFIRDRHRQGQVEPTLARGAVGAA